MPREITYAEKTVTRSEETVRYTCSGCGRALDPEDSSGEDFPHELIVTLDDGECVSSKFLRDYCNDCLNAPWEGICALIKADPEDISGSDFEDYHPR